MIYEFEKVWNELRKKLTDEQIFSLFTMLLFSCSQGQEMIELKDSAKISKHHLNSIIEHEQSIFSEYKEAFKRISARLDWEMINANQEALCILYHLQSDLLNYPGIKQDSIPDTSSQMLLDNLGVLFEEILRIAGRAGIFVETPESIRYLIEELMSPMNSQNIADFCCGSGGLGLNLWKRHAKNGSNTFPYFTDVDSMACDVTRINLYMHGITSGYVIQRDLLAFLEDDKTGHFDLLVMDIPRGRNSSQLYNYNDIRISNFDRKSIYSDWVFIQDALYHLKEQGYAIIIATTSTLIRSNETILRKQIIEKDWLEAVITLPPNLYLNTRTGTELLIFNKNKSDERRGKVLFIDISKYCYRSQRNAYSISERGHAYACDIYFNYKEKDGISAIQEISMIDSNTCSFKPLQYIQQKDEPDNKGTICLKDVSQIMRGAQVSTQNRDAESGNAYFINIKDIQNNRVLYETADRIQPGHQAYKEKFCIYEDDILITSKGTAIKMAIVEAKPPLAFISGNITIIRVDKDKYDPYVLFEYLDSKFGRIALERIQSGTTIRILNNRNLQELKIPEYRLERMRKVGMHLKENRKELFMAQQKLLKDYEREKRALLELIFKEA